ncbi:hypothetical protein [Kitasatospora sp. NPDC017646]|uniref:hypothetical protein n=1 Tax=Kitasatospora sp. NPDC017646 TaxID=3364024 RepID=UPI00379BE05A
MKCTTHDEMEAQTDRAFLRSSAHTVVLADRTKVGRVTFATICPLADVHDLVTDSGLRTPGRPGARDRGVRRPGATGLTARGRSPGAVPGRRGDRGGTAKRGGPDRRAPTVAVVRSDPPCTPAPAPSAGPAAGAFPSPLTREGPGSPV